MKRQKFDTYIFVLIIHLSNDRWKCFLWKHSHPFHTTFFVGKHRPSGWVKSRMLTPHDQVEKSFTQKNSFFSLFWKKIQDKTFKLENESLLIFINLKPLKLPSIQLPKKWYFPMFSRNSLFPYHSCMAYSPTFTIKNNKMQVSIPYRLWKGISENL